MIDENNCQCLCWLSTMYQLVLDFILLKLCSFLVSMAEFRSRIPVALGPSKQYILNNYYFGGVVILFLSILFWLRKTWPVLVKRDDRRFETQWLRLGLGYGGEGAVGNSFLPGHVCQHCHEFLLSYTSASIRRKQCLVMFFLGSYYLLWWSCNMTFRIFP